MKCVKWLACVILLLVVVYFAAVVLPCLRHKDVSAQYAAAYTEQDFCGTDEQAIRVLSVEDGTDALLLRFQLIEQAQSSIIYSTMDFRADESGTDVIACLLQAARRGVSVSLLVDGFGSYPSLQSTPLRTLAAEPNVSVRIYNRLSPLHPTKLMMRLHDKYLLVDESTYLLGGRNTNDLFLGEAESRKNLDKELLVFDDREDGSAEQLLTYFETIWSLPETTQYTPGSKQTDAESLLTRYESLRAAHPAAFEPADLRTAALPAANVTLLSNPPEAESRSPELWYSLVQLMRSGDAVLIQTPYLIADSRMLSDLADICSGADVTIVTNAVETGANAFGCADYLNRKDELLALGATLCESQSEQSNHSKCILIDDNLSIVGSFNLDMRSCYLDTELMLVVDSEALNQSLRQTAQTAIDASRIVTAEGETVGDAFPDLPLPWSKKLLYGVLRVIIPPFRYLL